MEEFADYILFRLLAALCLPDIKQRGWLGRNRSHRRSASDRAGVLLLA